MKEMKASRVKGLPSGLRDTIGRLTAGFDPAARESIHKRTKGAFAKIERNLEDKNPDSTPPAAAQAAKEGSSGR